MHRQRTDRGFTLIELLVVVAIIGIVAAIAIPNLLTAMQRSREKGLLADGQTLHTAFSAYHIDHDEYPPCCSPPAEALNTTTLHPLSTQGYLPPHNGITGKLVNGALTSYDSPDNPSSNHDFYAVLTLASGSDVVVLVADTDEYPGHDGERLAGLYLVRGNELVAATDVQ